MKKHSVVIAGGGSTFTPENTFNAFKRRKKISFVGDKII